MLRTVPFVVAIVGACAAPPGRGTYLANLGATTVTTFANPYGSFAADQPLPLPFGGDAAWFVIPQSAAFAPAVAHAGFKGLRDTSGTPACFGPSHCWLESSIGADLE